jgi:hypothetical protein
MSQMVEGLMRRDGPDEEDDESYLEWLLFRTVTFGGATVPIIRDFIGMAEGFGYGVTPVDGFGSSLTGTYKGLAQALEEKKLSSKLIKSLIATFGFLKGAPVSQPNRIVDATERMFDGDFDPYAFLVGPNKRN